MKYEPTPFTPEGPQPLVRTTPAGATYPLHALGPLRPAVEAVQGEIQAPVAIPAQSALSVAALAVQGFADVEFIVGSCATSLYCLTTALSGERKSTCDKLLMAAVRTFELEQADAQHDAIEKHKNAHALWEIKRKAILNDGKAKDKTKSAGAQADLDALGPEPSPPPSMDRTVSDPTYQGLVRKFSEGMPTLGLFSDEGGQFFGGYSMGKENRLNTLGAFDDMWSGNPIKRTLGGDGSLVLNGRRLSIHLMAQPAVVREFMSDPMTSDIGFLPRFLMCEPTSTIGTRLNANTRTDTKALGAFSDRLKAILETPLPMDDKTRALKPRLLALAPQAREVLVQFSDEVEVAMQNGGIYAPITGYASKAAEQAARIAAVLTLWENLEAKEVSAVTMSNAVDLAEFYLGEALRLHGASNLSAETDKAEKLRVWLLDTWKGTDIVPSDIVQSGPYGLRERKAVTPAVKMLVDAGWLVPLDAPAVVRGKTRKEAYRIVKPVI